MASVTKKAPVDWVVTRQWGVVVSLLKWTIAVILRPASRSGPLCSRIPLPSLFCFLAIHPVHVPWYSRSLTFPYTTVVSNPVVGDDLLSFDRPWHNSIMHSRRSSHQLPEIKVDSRMYTNEDANTPPHSPFNRSTLRRLKRMLKSDLSRAHRQFYF